MNTRLLRRVAKRILAEPRRLEMETMHTPVSELLPSLRPPCGIVCCIAGWGVYLSGLSRTFQGHFPAIGGMQIGLSHPSIQSLFDVPNERLFYVLSWPEKFRDKHNTAKTKRGKARAAAMAIDDYIKTKGWTIA